MENEIAEESTSSLKFEVTFPGLRKEDLTREYVEDLIAAIERGIDKEGYACYVELKHIEL